MRLTLYSDYALRVLIYLGQRPGECIPTAEISHFYGVSNDHLVKVVSKLGQLDLIKLKRGRAGGITLACKPEKINLGKVVSMTEPDFFIAECFDQSRNSCPITPKCKLKFMLSKAKDAFLSELNQHTLDDLL